MSRRRKRGQKHKNPEIRHRERNGRPERRQAVDRGTQQVQDRRAWLAGDKDQTMTDYPLAILKVHGEISEEEHKAGCWFAWLYAVVVGKREPKSAVFYEMQIGRSLRDTESEEYKKWLQQCEANYSEARNVLLSKSRSVFDAVVDIAVYERVPNFMRPVFPSPGDLNHARKVRQGLGELVRVYQNTRRFAA